MNKKIKFAKQDDELLYNPQKFTDSYYQICQFKNPFTKLYETRKIIFNQNGDILQMFERSYKLDDLEKFMKSHKTNKYKMFPTKEMSEVALPAVHDMLETRSELLNNNSKKYANLKI